MTWRLLFVLLLGTTSCTYLHDRAADLADVVTVEAMIGLGLAADVKATELVHVGVGYAQGRKLGLRGRQTIWLRDREVGLPLSAILWIGAIREGELWRLGHLHTHTSELWHGESAWRLADIEVGAFAGFVGVRLGISPGELFDLLCGLLTLDPVGDDLGEEPQADEPSEAGAWLVGDLHDHCDPPDGGHAPTTPEATWDLAEAAGLDFVGINPHLWLRGRAPAQRPELVELGERVRALEGRDGPLVIPGWEVMLRGADSAEDASGHCLLLFRDLEQAYAFGAARDERAWVSQALGLPRDQRIWVPAHPWPHPRIRIPFFPDWAADWKQAEELPEQDVNLGGQAYSLWGSPWRVRPAGRGREHATRLARYRLPAAARVALPVLGGGRSLELGTADHETLTEAAVRGVAQIGPAGLQGAAATARDAAAEALGQALRRELSLVPTERASLELHVDAGRDAWLWAWFEREEPGAELSGWLSWATVPLDAAGQPQLAMRDVAIDGMEVLSGLVHLAARAAGRTGAELDRNQVFTLLDRRILAERRRLTPLAGSDNHRDLVFPTLWVFARERSRQAIFEALRLGRLCVGGPEASSFRVRTDRDPLWRAVGASPIASSWAELRWDGEAELFVDGESRGSLRGGYRHAVQPGEFHIYRIVRGPSWSSWIYVNLP